jgi:homoserine kinase type II
VESRGDVRRFRWGWSVNRGWLFHFDGPLNAAESARGLSACAPQNPLYSAPPMALLTQLPFDDAKELLLAYGFELSELTPLSAGSVNSNFFLKGRSLQDHREHSLFARIYEEQGEAGAAFELSLNRALKAADIRVADVVPAKSGNLYCMYKAKPFAIYEKLGGGVTCQARVTPPMARSVGAALAGVHSAPLGDLQLPESRFGYSGIEARLKSVEESGRKDLLPAVQRIRRLCDELLAQEALDLPKGLIHGDLFRDNVLVSGDHVVGLLDFESASEGTFAFDIMVTALAWCFGDSLDPSLTQALLEGYDSVRAVGPQERAGMKAEGRFACARFASTRLTDFSLRVAKGETPARDFGRFFERLTALEDGRWDAVLSRIVWRAT